MSDKLAAKETFIKKQKLTKMAESDEPFIDKHGNTIYSKKYKLLLSLDKTNKRKKKTTAVNSDPKMNMKKIENILISGPLYNCNSFRDYDPDKWCEPKHKPLPKAKPK
jgi:hypothetical protein